MRGRAFIKRVVGRLAEAVGLTVSDEAHLSWTRPRREKDGEMEEAPFVWVDEVMIETMTGQFIYCFDFPWEPLLDFEGATFDLFCEITGYDKEKLR
ncbi:hypothetical protein CMI37_17775 [Candidatus Pacearchaeota archaeon]|nr:hypothetical protein [Candidatus Pacearchaeota archaeon]|tara:strand:+ start:286 stop:573 length:288 start_codon:yes stop_codon:yes gene_type:complete